MKHCPHCGADLRENARFCARCMTVLNQKQVVPTPKYFPIRWLSAAVAVLVLCGAVWSGLQWQPQEEQDAIAPPVTTASATNTSTATAATTATTTADVPTTTLTAAASTTLTTLAETFPTSMESTTTSTTKKSISYPTYATIPTAPRATTGTTVYRTTTTSSTTSTTTTTTKKTTTGTTTTRPYWQDAIPAAVTEDGLPIEEVEWTYEPITFHSIQLPQFYNGQPDAVHHKSSITVSKTLSGVPLNQCIKVTGCVGTTSNGIYRVPATIDGKVVALVDFGSAFSDSEVALSVKRIYLPPDTVTLSGDIRQCTNLQALYFTADETWFSPEILPPQNPTLYAGDKQYALTIYTTGKFYPTFIWNFSPPVFMYACNGNVYDAESGIITNEQCRILYGNSQ